MSVQNSSRRSFCKTAGAGLAALPVSTLLNQCGGSQTKPNVIYIMADDLGYGDLGCYGQEKIRTPHIDRMAAEGMRFTDHYSGHPVCAPSRCSLMTGLHNGHAFIRGNYEVRPEGQLAIPSDAFTVAELFQQAGYVTGGVGKWGLGGPDSEGHPNKQGFDYWYGHLCQRKAHSYYPDYVWRNNEKVVFEDNDPAQQKGEYIHDYFTEEALQFIRRQQDGPFFLYLPYTIPHLEFVAPEDSMQEYRGKFPETPFAGTGYHEELPESPDIPFPGNYGPQSHPRAAYAAMITRMDRDVGRLLALLKELNIDDNTLVIFTSDNGAANGNSADKDFFNSCPGMRGYKGYVYEGGIRVPLIARWPGKIQAGSVSNHVSAFWDFLPTAAEIAGVAAPTETDGLSYLPTLLGQTSQQEHDYLYWEFKVMGFSTQAVRMNNWKAVRIGNRPFELYDLSTDMAERHNLADAQPDIAALLTRIMRDARTESKEFPLF